ncbi:hypothetical protein Acr_09g0000520 [Actinidia rufa]|uniref:Phorbol-ester/DAG-type domain-containing protein n=1 Tax=Actinidia rufa TaxID=165716 RepID=A0A7J0F5D7_9ERIC|nr:hypothetical protein Acr_09g0000520 [Actinidia rufa]
MELQHFLHPHPLTLVEEQNGDGGQMEYCSGCMNPIQGPRYICSDSECSFLLHKLCAEQPEKIDHPSRPQHPLTLINMPWVTYQCEACFRRNGDFVYYCDLCDLYLDLPCATLPKQIQHLGHNHPLMLQLKPSLFRCDACDKFHEIQEISYQCTTCHFWVLKDCVSLPDTVNSASHEHPLALTSCAKLEFSKFKMFCDVCSEVVKQKNCVYACAGCRYVAHVGCAQNEMDEKEDESDKPNQICLPLADESINLISHLVEQFSIEKNNSGESNLKGLVDHPFEMELSGIVLFDAKVLRKMQGMVHDHPLHRFDEYSGSEEWILKELKGDEMCNACMQRISAPYYGCSDCDFRLHKYCSELPDEIQHPLHPQHALSLLKRCFVECKACGDLCNGFAYYCSECRFNLDVKCATFPLTIKHEAHGHALTLEEVPDRARCRACQQLIKSRALQCTSCNFNVHLKCASLPRAVRHRHDEHTLVLTYSPPGGPTKEYTCRICKEEINPKQWLYYCDDCNNSLHTGCLFSVLNDEMNMKYPPITSYKHPHPLTFVRKSKDDPPPCDSCGNPCNGIAFQCKECDYNLDFECGSALM